MPIIIVEIDEPTVTLKINGDKKLHDIIIAVPTVAGPTPQEIQAARFVVMAARTYDEDCNPLPLQEDQHVKVDITQRPTGVGNVFKTEISALTGANETKGGEFRMLAYKDAANKIDTDNGVECVKISP